MAKKRADNKTAPTAMDVDAFLMGIIDDQKRSDCADVLKMMKQVTGEKPRMWGDLIVGFGTYHYKYASGREGDWFLTGFSPRKQNLSIYIMPGLDGYGALLKKLGPHKTGKSCLYIKSLADIDRAVLKNLIAQSVKHMKETYG
jgi:hypothetical protein